MDDTKYILEGREPKAVDLMTWAQWFGTADRHVSNEVIDGYRVSTVFLGINHNYGEGPPLLFETMVFSHDGDDLFCERAATWTEAEACHQRGIEFVRQLKTN